MKNAIIRSVELSIADHGCLSAWLHLDYGGSGQGFGGWCLYATGKTLDENNNSIGPVAGMFITRCCQIADVQRWEDLPGKTIRVDADSSKVHGIGNIVADDWFYPFNEGEYV